MSTPAPHAEVNRDRAEIQSAVGIASGDVYCRTRVCQLPPPVWTLLERLRSGQAFHADGVTEVDKLVADRLSMDVCAAA